MTLFSRASHPLYGLLPADIKGFESLAELALDMRWSWSHATDQIWRQLDPDLWDFTRNPWIVLQTAAREQIEQLLSNSRFRKLVADLLRERRQAMQAGTWFEQAYPHRPLNSVAYFSMEFMLSEALPIYSGGLGNVAGDQLKAASDLGVPVVGVGLLYDQGYFRQVIDDDGMQQAIFTYNDPGQLPVTPLRRPSGEWLRFQLGLPGYPFWLRVWQVKVGRVQLYLLDSNDPANFPPHRGITSELYGGGPYLRLMQELILGIGGWRLLTLLDIDADVCHLNEGHAALAVLERARTFMTNTGQSFEVALASTRAGNLFTTHTAVAAGLDRFAPELVEHCLGGYVREQLGISMETLLAMGRRDPLDATEPFNMAFLAIRCSGAVNAVSQLHGEVSRRLFAPLFHRWPQDDIPIGYVTNGIHVPSWDSEAADSLWTEACGKDRWRGMMRSVETDIRNIPDETLWRFRNESRKTLVEYTRARLSQQVATSGATADLVETARHLLDFETLTLGFARRFATYKRPDLLLHDTQRLLRLLTNSQRPVQLIIAGKAHPADQAGQAIIQKWMRFIRTSGARHHVVFLSDHDMLLTEQLVQGVDVWLNTPRRPWEACGTSGMKILVNGGINLSELDGWWAEAYTPDVGWALGDGHEHEDDPAWDAVEASALYDLLEHQVIPEFYSRDESGLSRRWVTRMRESMARLTPRFSTNRTVREYTERHYVAAAQAYRHRAANAGTAGEQIVNWCRSLRQNWGSLSFGAVNAVMEDGQFAFEVEVYCGNLDWHDIRVELYADRAEGNAEVHQEMVPLRQVAGVSGGRVYGALVPAVRPVGHYTPRIVAQRADVRTPLEADFILWQH